jgi:hypothetical protein
MLLGCLALLWACCSVGNCVSVLLSTGRYAATTTHAGTHCSVVLHPGPQMAFLAKSVAMVSVTCGKGLANCNQKPMLPSPSCNPCQLRHPVAFLYELKS